MRRKYASLRPNCPRFAREGRRWIRWFSAVAAATLIPSCSGIDTAEWKEEVQLHDGRVIVLEARATRGSSGFPTQHRGGPRSYELCYRPLKAYWKSPSPYPPRVFEIIGGKPYVVVPLDGCLLCFVHGFPSFSALVYRWEDGEWREAAPTELPAGVTRNLLGRVWSARYRENDARGFYSLEKKWIRDGAGNPATRAKRAEEFEREVRDTERGQCPGCKARGDTAVTNRKPADFEGRHSNGDVWCK